VCYVWQAKLRRVPDEPPQKGAKSVVPSVNQLFHHLARSSELLLLYELESIVFHVYVIVSESHRDRYYIGFSSRLDDRLAEHNTGKNPSTAGFIPWRFAAIFSFPSEQQARSFRTLS